jgi:hypothetical protein
MLENNCNKLTIHPYEWMKTITIYPKAQAKKKGKIDSSFMYLPIELDFNYKFITCLRIQKNLFFIIHLWFIAKFR